MRADTRSGKQRIPRLCRRASLVKWAVSYMRFVCPLFPLFATPAAVPPAAAPTWRALADHLLRRRPPIYYFILISLLDSGIRSPAILHLPLGWSKHSQPKTHTARWVPWAFPPSVKRCDQHSSATHRYINKAGSCIWQTCRSASPCQPW